MHGNVREWVQDCWRPSYRGVPTDGSAGLRGDCNRRVMRGVGRGQTSRGSCVLRLGSGITPMLGTASTAFVSPGLFSSRSSTMVWINFTEKEILTLPEYAGVYALAICEHDSRWVYVEETGGLRRRILYHFYGQSTQARCILPYAPKRVGYEKVNGGTATRLAREHQLTTERSPYYYDQKTPPSPDKVKAAWEESHLSTKSLKRNSILLQTPFLHKLFCIFTASFAVFL